MKETIKNYLDDFLVLPKAVKLFIFAVIGVLVLVCAYQSFSNYRINKKVADLEKMNVQLEKAAVIAQENARISEAKAIDENIRANNLESQIPQINSQIKQSDEQIKTQSKKSSDLNNSLQRVRVSRPSSASAIELERTLENRYRQSKPD